MWAVQMKHVWVTWNGGSKVCHSGLLPFIFECLAIDILQAHGCHTAGDNIEAGGDANNVEIVLRAILKFDAGLIEFGDWIVLDIDNVNIGSVELLEVPILKTWTFYTPRMRRFHGRQDVTVSLVLEPFALLLLPEVVDRTICFGIEKIILVVSEPVAETTVSPEFLEEPLTIFGGIFESVLFGEGVEKPAEAAFTQLEKLWVPFLAGPLLLGGKVT